MFSLARVGIAVVTRSIEFAAAAIGGYDNAVRMTTVGGAAKGLSPLDSGHASRSGTETPERIRFKAFPYSGVNDYMIFCEQSYLSVGGG